MLLLTCGFKVSPLSLVKNPMILLAIVALGITLGMPKLMENSMCLSSSLSPLQKRRLAIVCGT